MASHAVPIEVGGADVGSCVLCENMIYAGRPTLLFHDMHRDPVGLGVTACDQDRTQTKKFVCVEAWAP